LKAISAPVLELNPGNPLIKALSAKASAGNAASAVEDAAVILLGEARILDGELPDDPADFSARIAKLMEKELT
jgi:molecular chaperone HtpG